LKIVITSAEASYKNCDTCKNPPNFLEYKIFIAFKYSFNNLFGGFYTLNKIKLTIWPQNNSNIDKILDLITLVDLN
jgi:hypothetical protein